MLIILVVIYYIFLRYSPEQIITYSGYAIEGKEMVENLKSSDKSKLAPYLGLIAVQENDLIYKKLNSYYIGEDDKKEIDINYPIYINEGNALLNLGKNTKLITVNYEKVEGYPDFMMADGVMYNGADITRADGNKYLFLKSEDEIYTNVEPITITTANGEYTIKEFSNIYFAEDHIAYYEMEGMQKSEEQTDNNAEIKQEENSKSDNLKDSYLQYKEINPIDPDSKAKINGETITYKTLLERLDILQTEESNANNNKEENTLNETEEDDVKNTTNEENTIAEETTEQNNGNTNQNMTNTENNNNNDNNEDEWQEGMWEKPEVSCTDFEGEVYTIRTNLSVRDRAGVITRGITFEIYLDGRLNRRVQASQAGTLEITNLQPSSEYEIRGIFYYNDENGVEQEEEFYTGKVTTKSIDTLGTLDFSFQNGKIYSNKIELIHLKLNNNINEEVVRGISRVQVEIGDVAYRLTNAQIDELKAGKEIIYQTSENLTSNSKIKYEITAFDRYGNELKEKNNTGETITSKQAPTSSIRVTKQDVTEVDLEVTLTNKDNVSLENYRYEITNQSGDVVKQGTLGNNGVASNGNKDDLAFTDLDPNGYYQIVIYGDYDLENGEGEHQNSELGRGSFVTRPIASLGYMQVKIDDKEVTQDSINLGISIDENQTDARLLAILDKVEVVIYDEGKNIEDAGNDENNSNNNDSNNQGDSNNNQTNQKQLEQEETEVQRITFTQEQVEQLKVAEEVELDLERLNSNTKYRIDVITTVKQGSVEEVVEDKQNIDQVITLKMPAEVQIRNQFVIGTMIDLDMRIEDIDGADLVDKVRIEVRDKDNKLVDLSEMPTNAEWERKTYEDLTPNETYTILVYAPQYNEGSTDATYKADYLLKKIEIVTETGISGKLDLIGLEKTPSGKNLIDASSKVNWYIKCFSFTGNEYGLNYNPELKIITLGGAGTPRNIYYDLSKYLGQEVTISFKAKGNINVKMYLIEKNDSNMENEGCSAYETADILQNEWKEYTYTTILSKTGYIGFRVDDNLAKVEMQELQIELGSRKTDYEEFQYDYNANIAVTVIDARNEIITNDYYVRIYKNNEQIQEIRYEEIGEENKIENAQKTYNIDQDAIYKIELLVKIADRFYELDSQEFSTEGSREIKGIFNKNDYLKIQPYGEYIVLRDLDFRNTGIRDTMFGYYNDLLNFEGRIDYNGKRVIINAKKGAYAGLVAKLGKNGILENIVLDVSFDNEIDIGQFCGLAYVNEGKISNVMLNIIESEKHLNSFYQLFSYQNYGIIENFIVNCEAPIYINGSGTGSILVTGNRGIVQNGYIYGENIKIISGTTNETGIIVRSNAGSGIVQNIFNLISTDLDDESLTKKISNIVTSNADNGTVQNVYSVGIGTGKLDLNNGPNIYSKGSKKIYNNYYFADEIFTSELETKGNMLSLWDATFQNQILNEDDAFIVDELVNKGFYPQLNMPECMPAQDYIELPEVKDADLPDILSTTILEQGTNTVKVEFSVNNPSSETISDIQIENIETEILSQEYSNGKSTVIAELKNPVICVSKYNVLSISTKGAYGSTYKREYEEGERVINVDLYREIWNITDWKNINDSPTENYMLMADLNFVNEGNSVYLPRTDGIIDGRGHAISNLNFTNDIPLIAHVYGTFKNLHINNFTQEALNSYGGLIGVAESGSFIDNVHLSNVSINKRGNGNVGGLIRDAYRCTITNCSVNNVSINTEGTQNKMYAGGLAGWSESSTMRNCYVQGLEINNKQTAVTSAIGGLIGYASGGSNSIENCYVQGKINSVNSNVGGIVGNFNQNGKIENCYSKVNISTQNINAGGIVGNTIGGTTNVYENNLSIGNIYSTSGLESIDRIAGIGANSEQNNYAYERQLLNGYVREEGKGATLLNKEEVLNLNLGESYNYDKKGEGILPKLYNTEKTELLPNQEDIFLEDSDTAENMELEVENIEVTKPNTTEAEVTVRIKNPNEVEITGLEIEDMEVTEVTRNVTQYGITSITVRATPTRYYDSYKLTGIKYKSTEENQGSQQNTEEQIKEVEVEIPVQFYKEIYTYEDWQGIEEGTYQNYRLMADIDFSGRANIKNNITVNRLEAENNIYTLKNIELTYNTANTGLINNVKTSIKNIGFENIKLTNTAGSGNYCGVIATSNAIIENLSFKNITIEASKISYVGAIGFIGNGKVTNITLDTINVTGVSYVGGLTGRCDYEITNVEANNIIVIASQHYVGGILGYAYSALSIECTNINVQELQIEGNQYVGGIAGFDRNVYLSRCTITDSSILGKYYVGGIDGYCYTDGTLRSYYNTVNNCEISGIGTYIGGISGQSSRYEVYAVVSNSDIYGLSEECSSIGGMFGYLGLRCTYCSVVRCNIYSLGKDVGGLAGFNKNNSNHAPEHCYVKDTSVEGNNNVGGLIGTITDGPIVYNIVNAQVTAIGYNAGGIVGYVDNKNMSDATNVIKINNNGLVNSEIKALTKVGGLVGDTAKDIVTERKDLFFNNYIHAYIESEDTSNVSMGVGGSKESNETFTNTHIYKYGKINNEYVNETIDTYTEEQYVDGDDLREENTYRNVFGWANQFTYESLQNNKYPIPNNITVQEGVDLPVDPEISSLNLLNEENEDNLNSNNQNNLTEQNGITRDNEKVTENADALPSYKVYPISVNEINIDFSEVMNNYKVEGNNEQQGEQTSSADTRTYFTYYVNGEEKETVELSNSTKQTYTFKYNFRDTLEIKLTRENNVVENTQTNLTSDESASTKTNIETNVETGTKTNKNTEIITITPEDVRSEASLVGNNNAYLLGTSLYINGEIQQGNYVNVYDGYALDNSGQVVDIATNEIVTNANIESIAVNNAETSEGAVTTTQNSTYLEQNTKPLHTYDYKGNTIETYGTYSKVNDNIKAQIYNVRSGILSAISNNTDMKIDNNITDNYNNKEYQTILNTSGELVDLKEKLQYPSNFLSSNIKQIVQNQDTEKPEMMVLYNTGKVIVFNYVNGNIVYENNEKADSSLVNYLTRSFANIWNDYEDKYQEYEKSKELETKLAKLPVEEAIKESNKTEISNSNNSNDEVNNITSNKQDANSATNMTIDSNENNTTTNNATNISESDSYITVYNENTGEYEVYSEDEILNGEDENPVSETEKIKQNGLEGIYGYNAQQEETKPQANGAIIVIIIIIIAVISLVALRRIIIKSNKIKK